MDEKYISVTKFKESLAKLTVEGGTEATRATIARTLGKVVPQLLDDELSADVQPISQWISVKDRLPDEVEAEVLVWIEDGTADDIKIYNSLHIAYWYGDTKLFYDFHCDEIKGVTHWMYVSAIPEPTKDGDTE